MQTHEVKHFNWLNQRCYRKWCCQRVGLRYFDAPLPMKMHCYSQFIYRRFTVNPRRCFSVCFTPRGGHDPPCRTYIYIDDYTDQYLAALTIISCLSSHFHGSLTGSTIILNHHRYRTHTTEFVRGLYGVTTEAYWAYK
jgi:hypothetical protein